MRRTLGTAVFAGMLGVTIFGIFLTPVFFSSILWFQDKMGIATTAPGVGLAESSSSHDGSPLNGFHTRNGTLPHEQPDDENGETY